MVDEKYQRSLFKYQKLMILRKEVLYLGLVKLFIMAGVIVLVLSYFNSISILDPKTIEILLSLYVILSSIYMIFIYLKIHMNNICPFCGEEFFRVKTTGRVSILDRKCQSCRMPK